MTNNYNSNGRSSQPKASFGRWLLTCSIMLGSMLLSVNVNAQVTVTNPTTGAPMTVPFIIGASPDSAVEVKLKSGGSGTAGSKERVYWYIQQ